MPQLHKFRVLRRLAEVTVRAEPVHLLAVAHGVGRCDDQHQGVGAPAQLAHVPQNVAALLPGEIDIKNDQGRTGRALVALGGVQEPKGFLAVLRNMNVGIDQRPRERVVDQEQIGTVILDDQDVPPWPRLGVFRRGLRIGKSILVRVRIRPRSARDSAPRCAGRWPDRYRCLNIPRLCGVL